MTEQNENNNAATKSYIQAQNYAKEALMNVTGFGEQIEKMQREYLELQQKYDNLVRDYQVDKKKWKDFKIWWHK